jgi:hypothetical protein
MVNDPAWRKRPAVRSGFLHTVVLASVVAALPGCDEEGDTAAAWSDVPTATFAEDLRIDAYEADLVPISWLEVSASGRLARGFPCQPDE